MKRLAARLGVATSSPNFVAILSVVIILVDIWLSGLPTIYSVWLAFCKKTLIGVLNVTKWHGNWCFGSMSLLSASATKGTPQPYLVRTSWNY